MEELSLQEHLINDLLLNANKELNEREYQLNTSLLTSSDTQEKQKSLSLLTKISLIKAKLTGHLNYNSKEPDYYLLSKLLKQFKKKPNEKEAKLLMKMLNDSHIHCLSEDEFKEVPKCFNKVKQVLKDIETYFTEENYSKLFHSIPLDKNTEEKVYLMNTDWLNVLQRFMNGFLRKEATQPANASTFPVDIDIDNKWINMMDDSEGTKDAEQSQSSSIKAQSKPCEEEDTTPSKSSNSKLPQGKLTDGQQTSNLIQKDESCKEMRKILILHNDLLETNKHLLKLKLIEISKDTKDFKNRILAIPLFYPKNTTQKLKVDLYKINKENKSEISALLKAYTSKQFIYYSRCPITEISQPSEIMETSNDKHYLIAHIVDLTSQQRFTISQEKGDALIEKAFINKWRAVITSQKYYLGIRGLKNLTNTCYINSTLQCLANTVELAQFFLFQYPLHSYEYNNQIIEQFREFISEYWTSNLQYLTPNAFKAAYGKEFPEFDDYKQHDAQEFLVYLINELHKGLKLVTSKDQLLSKQQLTNDGLNQKKNHKSIITNLLYGESHTELSCQVCNQKTEVNEPFNVLYLILPLFKANAFLYFFHENSEKNDIICEKVPFDLFSKTGLFSLIHLICEKYPHLAANNIGFLPISDDKIAKYYEKGNVLVLYEKKAEDCLYTFIYDDQGIPLRMICLLIDNSMTIGTIQELISNESQLGLLHSKDKKCHLCQKEYNPLSEDTFYCFLKSDDNIQSLYEVIQGDILLRALSKPNLQQFPYGKKKGMHYTLSSPISLQDCLKFYITPDLIDNWICPLCIRTTKVKKMMNIASPPKYLMIQLKRFRQTSTRMVKEEKLIDFPLFNLDLAPYLTYMSKECMYDLYGVIYHFGTLDSGHYNAICYNVAQNAWVEYNDNNVRAKTSGRNIVTDKAYLLFYKSRNCD